MSKLQAVENSFHAFDPACVIENLFRIRLQIAKPPLKLAAITKLLLLRRILLQSSNSLGEASNAVFVHEWHLRIGLSRPIERFIEVTEYCPPALNCGIPILEALVQFCFDYLKFDESSAKGPA